ncbi:hypothetical protein [Haloarcula halophila]|uniref:hypothetical protein n=1 Tax=Haloarcula TaxID=2237 RepID=UPI0023E43102|nr:hypothetical protein [Halomicroarcula sp. DFY41]
MRHDIQSDRTETAYDRRQVLASLGTAVTVGLAGCSGEPGSGGDGGSSTSDGGSGTSDGGSSTSDGAGDTTSNSSQTCLDIGSGEYLRFDPGERPFTYTCDYPDVFGEQSAATPGFDENQEGVFIVKLQSPDQNGDFLQLNLQQFVRGTTRDQATFPEGWEELTQTEFNGETVTARRSTTVRRTKEFWRVYLPYEIDGRTLYFESTFNLSTSPNDDEPVSEECLALMEETAIHMTESLAHNPDATGLKVDPFVGTPTTTTDPE